MTSTPGTTDPIAADAHHLAELIRDQFRPHQLVPQLYRMLAKGQPVTIDQIANEGGWTPDEVRAELDRHPGLDWDDTGRLAGFGLTLRRTPHRFTFDDRTVHAFCASDALLFPVILERPGVVESTCPSTGQPIRVHVAPDSVINLEPAGTVVTRIRPDRAVTDVRVQICALGNFFASTQAAAGWLQANPHGSVVSLHDDFHTTRRAAIELDWTTS